MARAPLQSLDAIAAALPDFDVEQAETLRQLGKRDPLPGTPWDVEVYPGGEPEPIEPGAWVNMGIGDGRTGLPPGCPVVPLGKDGADCYFLDTLGAVFQLDAKSSGKGPIGYMFAGRSRFLEWAWPRFGRAAKGRPPPVTGWDADDARQSLVDACAYLGYFTMEDQVRGRGAWRDDDGSLIYHAGDAVWIGGKWRGCGVHGRHIYPARLKLGRPTVRAHPAGVGSSGDLLLELLRTFNWDRGELDARLMLGWLMTAKMGGALDRRPVAFVVGGEGSGKSTLHGLLRLVMTGALIKTSNTTQAGIYGRLRQDSVAIMVDEMEAKEDTRTVDKILELARICYSGDNMNRGTKDGGSLEFTLFSSFMGSSIAKPATDAQDDSRMAVLMLRERETAGGKLDTSREDIEQIGRDLMRRIFDWWPRWDALVEAFRAMMITTGHKDRACDTFAPLAAGYHIATSDQMPTEDDLAPWRDWLAPHELAETATREASWERCWWHMMDAQPESLKTAARRSVGAAVNAWRSAGFGELEAVTRTLTHVGLALSWPKGCEETFELARLFVPLKSPPLHELFAGTPWKGRLGAPGPWGGVLRQMPKHLWKMSTCDKTLNRAARGLMIDLAALLEHIEEAQQ